MPGAISHEQMVLSVQATIQDMAQVAGVADVQQGLGEQALAAALSTKRPVVSSQQDASTLQGPG